MIDYSKKSKEHLFLIFMIGGVFGFLDSGRFSIGYFFGSGMGMIIIAAFFLLIEFYDNFSRFFF